MSLPDLFSSHIDMLTLFLNLLTVSPDYSIFYFPLKLNSKIFMLAIWQKLLFLTNILVAVPKNTEDHIFLLYFCTARCDYVAYVIANRMNVELMCTIHRPAL